MGACGPSAPVSGGISERVDVTDNEGGCVSVCARDAVGINGRMTFTTTSTPPVWGALKNPQRAKKISASHFERPNFLCCNCGFVYSGQPVVWPINKDTGEAGLTRGARAASRPGCPSP